MKKTLTTGSISHGTLRTQDLLRAFADEVARLAPHDTTKVVLEARALAEELDDGADYDDMILMSCDSVMTFMSDLLDQHAPHGYYFGAHEGDASDFGYWPLFDRDDELSLGEWFPDPYDYWVETGRNRPAGIIKPEHECRPTRQNHE